MMTKLCVIATGRYESYNSLALCRLSDSGSAVVVWTLSSSATCPLGVQARTITVASQRRRYAPPSRRSRRPLAGMISCRLNIKFTRAALTRPWPLHLLALNPSQTAELRRHRHRFALRFQPTDPSCHLRDLPSFWRPQVIPARLVDFLMR